MVDMCQGSPGVVLLGYPRIAEDDSCWTNRHIARCCCSVSSCWMHGCTLLRPSWTRRNPATGKSWRSSVKVTRCWNSWDIAASWRSHGSGRRLAVCAMAVLDSALHVVSRLLLIGLIFFRKRLFAGHVPRKCPDRVHNSVAHRIYL